ncbi:MAG: hypothetical protein P8Y66_11755 [Nitrospirota bacterium]|jgi:hypothetical protein
MKKGILASLLLLLVLSVGVPPAHGGDDENVPAPAEQPSIRYGASCRGPYGAMHSHATLGDAVNALIAYFEQKGLKVVITGHDRRFILADIYRGEEQVDSIVLDARTGRMRSVY